MNGQNILDNFKSLIDDAPSDEECLILLNIIKDMIEGDRPWRMLIKEDSSQTFGAGEDYTDSKDLPSDFFYDVKLKLGIAANDDYLEYEPCAFEERRQSVGSQRYCVDVANSKLYILGTVSKTYTIYLYYVYKTDEITLTTSPVWPTKFQRLIPLLMAELWKSGLDSDVWNIQQALSFSKYGQILYNQMIEWDASLKLQSMNHSTPYHRSRMGQNDSGFVQDPDNLLNR